MVSFKAISIGVCLLYSMTVPAHADVLDQLRMASTGGPFTFTISPASPLPAVPRDPVNSAPLSAKPGNSPAAAADAAAQPEEGDVAAKAAKQHDEDAANAGLHVAPRQQNETDEPADHPALSEMTRANAVPPRAAKAYTPIPTDIGSLLSALTRTKGGHGDKAESTGENQPEASAPLPIAPTAPPPERTAAVPPPAVPTPPPQYVPATPSYPPQIIIVQPLPYPSPQYSAPPIVVYGPPPQAVGQYGGMVAPVMPTVAPQATGGVSDIQTAARPSVQDYRQEIRRRQVLQQQRFSQMPHAPSPTYHSGPGVFRPTATYRLAYNRPAVHGMRIGRYR
jgi:hypothetical protein